MTVAQVPWTITFISGEVRRKRLYMPGHVFQTALKTLAREDAT